MRRIPRWWLSARAISQSWKRQCYNLCRARKFPETIATVKRYSICTLYTYYTTHTADTVWSRLRLCCIIHARVFVGTTRVTFYIIYYNIYILYYCPYAPRVSVYIFARRYHDILVFDLHTGIHAPFEVWRYLQAYNVYTYRVFSHTIIYCCLRTVMTHRPPPRTASVARAHEYTYFMYILCIRIFVVHPRRVNSSARIIWLCFTVNTYKLWEKCTFFVRNVEIQSTKFEFSYFYVK